MDSEASRSVQQILRVSADGEASNCSGREKGKRRKGAEAHIIQSPLLPLPFSPLQSSEPRPRLVDVTGNLGFQFVKGRELLLVTEPGGKSDLQFFAVKIAAEVKEVNFNPKLGRGVLQRRTMADVQDGAISWAGVASVSSFIYRWGGKLT